MRGVDERGTTDLEHARRAKKVLAERFCSATWWRGAGLTPAATGWLVRVDVAVPCDELPGRVDGVPVQVRVVGDVTVQPETD